MFIRSVLDTDLYKLTMQQAVIAHFPDVEVRYELTIRTPREFRAGFGDALRREVAALSTLALAHEEASWLGETCRFLTRPYVDFLRGYRFDPSEVAIEQRGADVRLAVEGYWYRTILWEVPLMALLSELFFGGTASAPLSCAQWKERACAKARRLQAIGAQFADFGTRRRYSFDVQAEVVACLKACAPDAFVGTSNVLLAMRNQCRAMGTQAHEWYMALAALYGYESANRVALERWVDVYQGALGIALTDTFTTEVFFRDFGAKHAKLFDGVRQDSGDPIEFVRRAIEHYERLRIDPHTKTVIFSDALDVPAVERIHAFCAGKIRDSYGIGTNLTNDVGAAPLNMVIKLSAVKVRGAWVPVVKLSDDPGKHTGSAEALRLCREALRIA